MRKSAKIITALSVAGLTVAAGSAFTGVGFNSTAGAGFVGGSLTQTVDGATLTATSYTNTEEGAVTGVNLTFAAGDAGRAVTAVVSDGATTATMTCPVISDTNVSACALGTAFANATSLKITVS